jgi:hypothetical protein
MKAAILAQVRDPLSVEDLRDAYGGGRRGLGQGCRLRSLPYRSQTHRRKNFLDHAGVDRT